MNTATIRRNRRSTSKRKVNSGSHIRVYGTMVLAGAIVITGFFLAATQHFSVLDFSMKNSQLRRQIDALQAEKRRLLVAREVSLSPAEIKKAAEKAALLSTAPAPIAQAVPKPTSTATVAVQRKEPATAPAASTVVRTTFVRPAIQPTAPVQVAKRTTGESERRRIVSNAE
ncbi:MAG: hypothetical protein DYH05_05330 [Acidobacteria bacterium ACB1]|nr:hypothetical protein [Pyrinomonadaceae bacterium]MCE7961907.1 hypothetical protein [Acidobacteria bacterium ACB1]